MDSRESALIAQKIDRLEVVLNNVLTALYQLQTKVEELPRAIGRELG